MARFITLLGAILLTTSLVAVQRPAASQAKLIAHGKYVVTLMAMCGDCHSLHNEKGEEIPGRELQGSALFFKPLQLMPVWVNVAPPIADLED